MPIVKAFEAEGRLRRVSADKSVEDVWAEVKALLEEEGM